jgi:hypothetical protein
MVSFFLLILRTVKIHNSSFLIRFSYPLQDFRKPLCEYCSSSQCFVMILDVFLTFYFWSVLLPFGFQCFRKLLFTPGIRNF